MSKLRQSARGQPCAIRVPGICCFDPETTVLAHINSAGKGMGLKSEDWFGIFACYKCHTALDQHKIPLEQRSAYVLSALYETWRYWVQEGLIVIKETK